MISFRNGKPEVSSGRGAKHGKFNLPSAYDDEHGKFNLPSAYDDERGKYNLPDAYDGASMEKGSHCLRRKAERMALRRGWKVTHNSDGGLRIHR